MVGFHNRSSELYHRMVNEGAGGLAEKIRKEDPSAAFRDMLRYMDAIPASAQRAGRSAADAVQIQRHFVGEAFGDEDFAQILGKGMTGFESAYADAAKDVGVITDAMVKAAADFDVSISQVRPLVDEPEERPRRHRAPRPYGRDGRHARAVRRAEA